MNPEAWGEVITIQSVGYYVEAETAMKPLRAVGNIGYKICMTPERRDEHATKYSSDGHISWRHSDKRTIEIMPSWG